MRKLEVRLAREPGRDRVVGHLAESGRRVYFEYDPAFLREPLWLSPFKLPPEPGLVEHRDHAFGPVFGLFDDSLPDGWGLLLMDRFFQARILTRNHQDVSECFRRMVFNVLAHNRDDHVKNFAFRLTDAGEWELAPAYDLVLSAGPGGEHTMTIAGEGRAPGRSHLLEVASKAGISGHDAESILQEVASAVGRWRAHARRADVGKDSTRMVGTALDECLARL